MLYRSFFESIFNQLSRLFNILRPSSRSHFTKPETLHHVVIDDVVNKFDEVIIIGDIHGCFDEFMLLLEQLNNTMVQSNRILKICAGDLVNKGPKSKEVLDYMMAHQDSCLAVRGNHDEVVINELTKYFEKGDVKENNAWMKQLSKAHLEYLTRLPYTISVPKLNLIVVHAGLVPELDLEQQNLHSMTHMRNLVETKEGVDQSKVVLQPSSSVKEGVPWASMWNGPSHIYFGHDAKRKLQEYPFATGLDTGLVYGGSLTGIFVKGPRTGNYISVKALQIWKEKSAT